MSLARGRQGLLIAVSVAAAMILLSVSVANAAEPRARIALAKAQPGVFLITGSGFPAGTAASLAVTTRSGKDVGTARVSADGSLKAKLKLNPRYSGLIKVQATAAGARAGASFDLPAKPIPLKLYDETAPGKGNEVANLQDRQVIDVSSLGSPNIWALPGSGVKSVRFCLDNGACRVEANAPFAMHDDEAPEKWRPSKGRHTLDVTGYSTANATGKAVAHTYVAFQVGSGAQPSKPSTPVTQKPEEAAPSNVPVGGKEVFVGDFETGDFDQWSNNCHAVSDCGPPSIEIQSKDTRNSKFAGHFIVHDGDTPIDSGERSEVRAEDPGSLVHNGDERWYQVSYKFPANFKLDGDWLIVTQWHATNDGSPPVAIEIRNGDELTITSDGADNVNHTIGKIPVGKWSDYVFHIKFSENKSEGFVEAWQDGKLVVPKVSMRTMATEEAYLKAGIYRDNDATGTSEVWMDNFRVTAP